MFVRCITSEMLVFILTFLGRDCQGAEVFNRQDSVFSEL